MKKSFINYLLELDAGTVGRQLSLSDDQAKAQSSQTISQRQQAIAKQQAMQSRSFDPLERQIAQARAHLAMLMKQKADRDKNANPSSLPAAKPSVQPGTAAPATTTTESVNLNDKLESISKQIYEMAEKAAYDESATYSGGTRVTGDEIEHHAKVICTKIRSHVNDLIKRRHM